MPGAHFVVDGIIVPASALALRRARAVAEALSSRDDAYATLVECRKRAGSEIVVVDLEIDTPQMLVHPIERVERVALVFHPEDKSYPEVLALRRNFPNVLHLNQRPDEFPRGLCLYDRPWPEVRINWTAAEFLERIRWWFAGTARGKLHADDQPLEPLLLSAGYWLIVPPSLGDASTPCMVVPLHRTASRAFRVLPLKEASGQVPTHTLLRLSSPPRQHGTSPKLPQNFHDLLEVLKTTDFDPLVKLRQMLKDWPQSRDRELDALVVLLVGLPKTRVAGGEVVATDFKACLTSVNLRDLGQALGVWTVSGKSRSMLLAYDQTRHGQDVEIGVLNVTSTLTPELAAHFNAIESRQPVKTVAVGAGALGSQVILNLSRAGHGPITVVDDDLLLPHNLARHALDGTAIGVPKAIAVAAIADSLVAERWTSAIEADVLDPGEKSEKLEAALTQSDVVLDLSASVPVARLLSGTPGGGRRLSVFLSPSGRDLVLLAEDRQRRVTLEELEMMYYAGIVSDARLRQHLEPPPGRLRYGLSCRDIASRMPQSQVGMFAGVASKAVQVAIDQEGAAIRLWMSDPDRGRIEPIELPLESFRTQSGGAWRIRVSDSALREASAMREKRRDRETGGILVGVVDHDQSIIYVLRALPSPPDSLEWPTLYIRGSQGMREVSQTMLDITAGAVVYLGEWHSHPPGFPTRPSADDENVLAAVEQWVRPAGQPGLIMIVGDAGRARVLSTPFDRQRLPEEL